MLLAVATAPAAHAEPVSGPRQTVDNRLTTTQPASPSGFHYTARYHAAGDPSGDPPYMRRMISHNPPGMVFDTDAAPHCTASDLELALSGAAACPPGSVLGGGTVTGKFMGSETTLAADFINNANEQIIVVRSPLFASVSRGTIHPDGSVEFASPTCYPALNPPGCTADNALQLGSDIAVPPTGTYLTTPPTCPKSRYWETPIEFFWADGSHDVIVTRQPCTKR